MLLLTGRVKIYSLTEQGTEIVLAVQGPGTLLGELSVVDGAPRAVSVRELEPLQAIAVPAPAFLSFLRGHPNAALRMVQMIIGRLRDVDRKRAEFGAFDTLGRVSLRLVELAERFGTREERGIRITEPFTQDELASWIGSSREAVAKALRTAPRGRRVPAAVETPRWRTGHRSTAGTRPRSTSTRSTSGSPNPTVWPADRNRSEPAGLKV